MEVWEGIIGVSFFVISFLLRLIWPICTHTEFLFLTHQLCKTHTYTHTHTRRGGVRERLRYRDNHIFLLLRENRMAGSTSFWNFDALDSEQNQSLYKERKQYDLILELWSFKVKKVLEYSLMHIIPFDRYSHVVLQTRNICLHNMGPGICELRTLIYHCTNFLSHLGFTSLILLFWSNAI